MSYLTVYVVDPQTNELRGDGEEFRNAHGGVGMILDTLGGLYHGTKLIPRGEDDYRGWDSVTLLYYDARLTRAHWCVLVSTFNHVWIPPEHLIEVAAAYEAFERDVVPTFGIPGRVNHIPSLAAEFRKLHAQQLGAAVDWTSLCDSAFPSGVVNPKKRLNPNIYTYRPTRFIPNGPVGALYKLYFDSSNDEALCNAWREGLQGRPLQNDAIFRDVHTRLQHAWKIGNDEREWLKVLREGFEPS